MHVARTAIPEVLIIEPQIFRDNRGFFMELYRGDRYAATGTGEGFVQDNISRSTKGVLRGLHFQNPNPQGKLVTVLSGAVLDIAVDVRVGSPTFGQHVSFELNDRNRCQCWIPRGFAHGFVVLTDTADLLYKCDAFYSQEDENVLRWDDPKLGIDWHCDTPIVSPRDRGGHTLAQLQRRLPRYESA